MVEEHNKEELREIISDYESFFQEIWEMVSGIAGELTLEFIIKVSIKKISPAFAFLEYIKVSSKGLSFEGLKNKVDEDEVLPHELKRGFHALISEILTLFSIMWGEAIARELSNRQKNGQSNMRLYIKQKKDF